MNVCIHNKHDLYYIAASHFVWEIEKEIICVALKKKKTRSEFIYYL